MQHPSHRHVLSSALIASLCLVACGPPPAPPPPRSPQKAPPAATVAPLATAAVTAVTPPPPRFTLVHEPRVPPVCGAPPVSEQAPGDAELLEVALPANTPALLDVEGRDDRDIWLLPQSTDGRDLLHWSGASLRAEQISCRWGRGDSLVLGQRDMIVRGTSSNGEYTEYHEARYSPGRGWTCPDEDARYAYLPLAGEMLRLSGGGEATLSGLTLALPNLGAPGSYQGSPDIAGRAADDLWLTTGATQILHWNGVAWEDRSPGLSITDLHVAPDGAVWLAGNESDETDPSESGRGDRTHDKPKGGKVVLRWDAAALAWVCLPTPGDLYTVLVRGVGAQTVWLIGERDIYRWDGKTLQHLGTPIPHPKDAWLSPSGALWLVGYKDSDDLKSKVGLAFHTRGGHTP